MHYSWEESSEIEALVGHTLLSVEQNGDEIHFTTKEGVKYVMCHEQDCCENVFIESVVGDWEDIVGSPILVAEERQGEEPLMHELHEMEDSYTWTFYTIRTIKGSVDIRWFGSSNGYYSERVDFFKITK